MAGAPHQRLPAPLADPRCQVAGALHVVDDGGAGILLQHVGRIEHQLPVGEDHLTAARDHAQPVAVPIESQADIGIAGLHLTDQVTQVLGVGRIGVMVREMPVHLAIQLGEIRDAQRPQQRRCHRTRHAVACIHHHLQGAGQLHLAGNAGDVVGHHVQRAHRARRGGKQGRITCRISQRGRDVTDVLAVQRGAAQHHLQAVVLGRVVAAGDGHARATASQHRGEVHQRRGHHADVDHVHPGGTQPGRQRSRQRRARQPAVTAHHHLANAPGSCLGAQRQADGRDGLFRQCGLDDAADVIGLEDGCGDHRRLGRWKDLIDHGKFATS